MCCNVNYKFCYFIYYKDQRKKERTSRCCCCTTTESHHPTSNADIEQRFTQIYALKSAYIHTVTHKHRHIFTQTDTHKHASKQTSKQQAASSLTWGFSLRPIWLNSASVPPPLPPVQLYSSFSSSLLLLILLLSFDLFIRKICYCYLCYPNVHHFYIDIIVCRKAALWYLNRGKV